MLIMFINVIVHHTIMAHVMRMIPTEGRDTLSLGYNTHIKIIYVFNLIEKLRHHKRAPSSVLMSRWHDNTRPGFVLSLHIATVAL